MHIKKKSVAIHFPRPHQEEGEDRQNPSRMPHPEQI
jgi:hypothetical protein